MYEATDMSEFCWKDAGDLQRLLNVFNVFEEEKRRQMIQEITTFLNIFKTLAHVPEATHPFKMQPCPFLLLLLIACPRRQLLLL